MAEQVGREAELRPHQAPKVNVAGIEETVTDKGYHIRQCGQGTGTGSRTGRWARLSVLRRADGEKRILLSVSGVWQHERMLMMRSKNGVWHGEKREQSNLGRKCGSGSRGEVYGQRSSCRESQHRHKRTI